MKYYLQPYSHSQIVGKLKRKRPAMQNAAKIAKHPNISGRTESAGVSNYLAVVTVPGRYRDFSGSYLVRPGDSPPKYIHLHLKKLGFYTKKTRRENYKNVEVFGQSYTYTPADALFFKRTMEGRGVYIPAAYSLS